MHLYLNIGKVRHDVGWIKCILKIFMEIVYSAIFDSSDFKNIMGNSAHWRDCSIERSDIISNMTRVHSD